MSTFVQVYIVEILHDLVVGGRPELYVDRLACVAGCYEL